MKPTELNCQYSGVRLRSLRPRSRSAQDHGFPAKRNFFSIKVTSKITVMPNSKSNCPCKITFLTSLETRQHGYMSTLKANNDALGSKFGSHADTWSLNLSACRQSLSGYIAAVLWTSLPVGHTDLLILPHPQAMSQSRVAAHVIPPSPTTTTTGSDQWPATMLWFDVIYGRGLSD